MKVRDFMTSVIITADQDIPVVDAARLMAAEEIGSLVITRADVMVGIITQRDIVSAQLLSDESYHELRAKDIMAQPVVSITPDADLWQAISLMDQTGKKHIPVIEGESAVGLISATDLIRVLATMKMIINGVDEN